MLQESHHRRRYSKLLNGMVLSVDSFIRWRKDIDSYLVPPQLELKQSKYDKLKAEHLGLIMNRIRDLFTALKMKECVMMKLLNTISI